MSTLGANTIAAGLSRSYAIAPAPAPAYEAQAVQPPTAAVPQQPASYVDAIRNMNFNVAVQPATTSIDAGSVGPLGATPTTGTTDAAVGAMATQPTGVKEHRGLFEGATSPFDAIPTFFKNVVGNMTGKYDDRYGQAGAHILQSAERLISSGLRKVAMGEGAIATGSSILRKVMPVINFALGGVQVWKGWNELIDHSEGPLSIIHSKTARGGLLGIAAGATLFIPGIGGALAGAALLATMAANDLDAFHGIDWETQDAENNPTYKKVAEATGHLLTNDKPKPGQKSLFTKIKDVLTGHEEPDGPAAAVAGAAAVQPTA